MRNIAVFTVFRNTNYGAVLQAYALTHKLHSLTGRNVYLIDYIRDQNTNLMHNGIIYHGKHGKKSINAKSIKKLLLNILNFSGTVSRTNRFRDFIEKHLWIYQKPFYSGDSIELKDFDTAFLGSDQIWNPTLLKGFHDPYFGIVDSDMNRVVAYAPSLGKKTFNAEEQEELKQKLKNVDILSCREEDSCEFLRELTKREVTCVLDPTFLFDRAEWENIMDRECKLPDKYVLVYTLRFDQQLIRLAQEKARAINAKVVVLGSGTGKISSDMKGVLHEKAFGPQQFIATVAKASCVFTDSFHGTAFSIIFRKNFIVRAREEKGQRMEHLCRILRLNRRVFRSFEHAVDVEEPIDYEQVYSALNDLRTESIQYIQNALRN